MDEGGSHPGFFQNLKSLFGKGNSDKMTEEEIISMVNEGHEKGLLEANETELIHNIFEYGDKEAGDIMTHRKNIVAVDGTMKLKDALNYMLDQNYSRFPVYEENIDNIIGFLHFKDAVKANRDPKEQEKMIRELPNILRPARFIPETRNISDLLRTMQKQKLHFVIVVDEYGQTLNGFLISILDRIPADDEHIVINHSGYRFAVQSIQNKVIQKVHVSKLPESTETE